MAKLRVQPFEDMGDPAILLNADRDGIRMFQSAAQTRGVKPILTRSNFRLVSKLDPAKQVLSPTRRRRFRQDRPETNLRRRDS